MKLMFNDEEVLGSFSGIPIQEITKADYDSLSAEDKMAEIVYLVTDEGSGSFFVKAPVGTIVIWSGTVDNIPEGWHICDGMDGAPELSFYEGKPHIIKLTEDPVSDGVTMDDVNSAISEAISGIEPGLSEEDVDNAINEAISGIEPGISENDVKIIVDDAIEPLNTQITTGLAGKVDKVSGKGLSTNDFTTAEKNKLDSLNNYTLPTATSGVLGGVKIGNGIEISNGVISLGSLANYNKIVSSFVPVGTFDGRVLYRKFISIANILVTGGIIETKTISPGLPIPSRTYYMGISGSAWVCSVRTNYTYSKSRCIPIPFSNPSTGEFLYVYSTGENAGSTTLNYTWKFLENATLSDSSASDFGAHRLALRIILDYAEV